MTRALWGLSLSWMACATAGPAASPTPPLPDPVRALQRRPSRAAELTTALCDAAGPRLAGSEGEQLGVAWALRTMTALGLENVHTEPVEEEPRWVRVAESAVLTAPRAQPLAVTALGGSPSTPPEGVEAEVLEVTSLEALEALAPGAAAGRIVFANVPMVRRSDGAGYGQVAGVRRLAAKAGARAGAVAALIRSVGTDDDRLPHTGSQGVERSAIPAAALAIPDADVVHRLLAQGPVTLRLRLDTRHEAPAAGFNVVGEVVGRERPAEVVLLGAHLDSWDLGLGALDDGAGVGAVLDAARALLELPERPRRTVRVVLFANEENGLAGALAYAKAHAAELSRHVSATEVDTGGDRVLGLRVLGGEGARAVVSGWAASFAALGVALRDDDAHGGADTGPLLAAGVPAVDLTQDASRYFDVHHTANDTPAQVDAVQLEQVARAVATLAWLAAEQGGLGRVPEARRARVR